LESADFLQARDITRLKMICGDMIWGHVTNMDAIKASKTDSRDSVSENSEFLSQQTHFRTKDCQQK